MNQRIETFFEDDSQKCTFFEYNSKKCFFYYDSKIWTLFGNMAQRIEPLFLKWLKELNLSF